MRSVFGVVGFLGVIVASILAGSPMWVFIDLPSILIVLGTMIFLSISKHSFKEILSFSDEVVLSLINFSLMGGGIGFILGLVQMFQNMSDPSAIGPAMAVCILTVFYSLIIASSLYAIKKGINTGRIGVAGIAGGLGALIPVFILFLSFCKK